MRGRHTTTFLLYQIGASQAGMPDKWRIEGDYFEACNCDTVCSCIFLGNPDQGQCDLTSAWHIQGNSDRLPRYPQSHWIKASFMRTIRGLPPLCQHPVAQFCSQGFSSTKQAVPWL